MTTIGRTKLKIWDTAGDERYRSLTKKYYQDAQAVIIVYDITELSSFENLQFWISEIHDNVRNVPLIFLVGNKADCQANA